MPTVCVYAYAYDYKEECVYGLDTNDEKEKLQTYLLECFNGNRNPMNLPYVSVLRTTYRRENERERKRTNPAQRV